MRVEEITTVWLDGNPRFDSRWLTPLRCRGAGESQETERRLPVNFGLVDFIESYRAHAVPWTCFYRSFTVQK
jgi:hypothetical protein